ncbi:MAG: DUF2335 domain-containing protein [Ghiorsea sp.]
MTKKSQSRLNKGKRSHTVETQTVIREEHSLHIGILPDPQTLADYKIIKPELVDFIINHADQEQMQRHFIEQKAIDAPHTEALVGQIFALIIGVTGIASSAFLAYHDKTTAAVAIGGGTLVALATAFIQGRKPTK